MFVFCFNDCIPQNHSDAVADRCLNNSLREYHKLKQKFPEEIDGIVTSHTPSSVRVSQYSSLHDCMSRIGDHELKRFAFSVFLRFPIEPYYIIDNETELIENNFCISVGGTNYDAIYPFVVFRNQGVLFSLGVHNDICQNQIPIFSNTANVADVYNLFGHCDNTEYILEIIRLSIYNRTDNLGKLLMLIGNNKVSERFQKYFRDYPINVQQAVIDHFAEAIKRNLYTRFYPDDKLIKDVTPDREPDIKVFELRIFEPVGCRIYFYETPDCVYLGSIERKPSKSGKTLVQNSHIMTARNIIRELVAL